MVTVEVTNTRPQAATVLATTYFKDNPDIQFARELWVPPDSVRRAWCPVFPVDAPGGDTSSRAAAPASSNTAAGSDGSIRPKQPATAQPAPSQPTTRLSVTTLLFDRSSGQEVLVPSTGGQVARSTSMSIYRGEPNSGYIETMPAAPRDPAFESLVALRLAAGYSRRMAILTDRELPTIPDVLEGLDELLISNDRLTHETGAIVAIRRWLERGGRLWLCLDQLSEQTVALILGETIDWEVLDRVGLTRVKIQSTSTTLAGVAPPTASEEERIFERPVPLVRMFAPDAHVTHMVNGWPAAMWFQVGKGKVILTALGAEAWIRPRRPKDPPPTIRGEVSESVPTQSLAELGPILFDEPTPMLATTDELKPYVSDQIGYKVVGRGRVASLLVAFCCLLPAAGIVLTRWKRGEWLAIVAPLVALACALVLLALGWQSRQSVAPTVAQAQLIEVARDSDEITIRGLAGLYSPQATDARLEGRGGGLTSPHVAAASGVRRFVWTGLDRWHWENLHLPDGVHFVPFRSTERLSRPLRAETTLGPTGLVVKLGEFVDSIEDAIVMHAATAPMAIRREPDGRWVSGPEDKLALGQFVRGTLLTDEQRRRQEVYRAVAARKQRLNHDGPLLLGWLPPQKMGIQFPPDVEQVGGALVAIPLRIARPESGTQVVIPGALLSCRPVEGATGKSSLFDALTGKWSGTSQDATAVLNFTLPLAARGVKVDRALVRLKLEAPSRTLTVFLPEEGGQRVVGSRANPAGELEFPLAGDDLPTPDASGSMLLGVQLKGGTGLALDWRMEYVQLDLWGTMP